MTDEQKKTLLGDAYVEGMSDDDAINALAKLKSDLETNNSKLKTSFDKTSSELADLKKANKAKLSENEQKQLELDEKFKALELENKELKRNGTIAEYTANYIKLGYDDKLAKETAEAQFDGKNDIVFANQQKFMKTHDENFKAELLKGTPAPGKGGTPDDGAITKEKFDKMTYAEKAELFNNDRATFDSLSGQTAK